MFASVWVAEQVAIQFLEKEKQKLLTFLAASDGAGEAASARGLLFEGYVHNLLSGGGQFEVINLSVSGSRVKQIFNVPQRSKYIFKSRDEIKTLQSTQYAR